jgi:hypothetical protein
MVTQFLSVIGDRARCKGSDYDLTFRNSVSITLGLFEECNKSQCQEVNPNSHRQADSRATVCD